MSSFAPFVGGTQRNKQFSVDCEVHPRQVACSRLLHVNEPFEWPLILKAAFIFRCNMLIPSMAKES